MKFCKESRERRIQIMDAAEELFFREKDYQSTTVMDIIERVGLAKGTFYHYFRSKEDLLRAVLERQLSEFDSQVETLAKDPALSTMEKLEVLVDMIFQLRRGDQPELEGVFIHGDRVIQENFILLSVNRAIPHLSTILKDGIMEGIFHTDYPDEALRFILAGSMGLVEREEGEETDPLVQMKALADFTERVLGADPGSFGKILCDRLSRSQTN